VQAVAREADGSLRIELQTEDGGTETYRFSPSDRPLVDVGATVAVGQPIAQGFFINNIFYVSMSRLLLMLLFIFIALMVRIAYLRRKREGRLNP
jgi:hypothetical protein